MTACLIVWSSPPSCIINVLAAAQVAYDTCNVLNPDNGDAYGLIWTPNQRPAASMLPVVAAQGRPDCYWYLVRSGIAVLAHSCVGSSGEHVLALTLGLCVLCCCPSCFLQAGPGDYLSKIAFLGGLKLNRLLQDNLDTITDLDMPLQGRRLLLCNPNPG